MMAVLPVGALPESPLAAAAAFHAEALPRALALLAHGATPLTLVFAPADHTHRAWRLAAVQALAREHAPRRVNAVASADPAAIDAACRWLEAAPGITGQLLPLDSHGAGTVVIPQG
ncbi:MAG: hypothetical protein KGN34_10645 [Sphingomonadales bacterium]|nr:hypothetical protein [Sphingomonadales bacterium]